MKNKSDITILLDMDDTLENFVTAWVNALNKKYNKSVLPEQIVNWKIKMFYPELTEEEILSPVTEGDFWRDVKPKDNAVKYVTQLHEEGYKIYVCTASYYATIREKLDYALFPYFDFFKWTDIIIANKKQMIKGDILVDDYTENLLGGDYKKILMSAPHNQHFETEGTDITRANNWEEVYNIISEYARTL